MAAPPTVADLKTHLDITSGGDDAELQDMLDAAVDVVENIVGPISPRPVTETHYAVSGPTLVTRRAPVASVTNLSTRLYPGLAWADQSVGDYVVDGDTGVIRTATGYMLRGDVTITYLAGYATVPTAVFLATLIIAANLWETQRGADPLPANSTDDISSANVGFAPAIPDRAKTLLEPFALAPLVG